MNKNTTRKYIPFKILFFLVILLCVVISCLGVREFKKAMEINLYSRGHGRVTTEDIELNHSTKALMNPERGFYHMHGFTIKDTDLDFESEIGWRYCHDKSTTLTLIEVKLILYRDGDISAEGLDNVDDMFKALQATDKKIILRFLYDWHGKGKESEPEDISIILRHMEQLGPYLKKYSDDIFTLQGLFIGNWGEMNGSNYHTMDNLKLLSEKLAEVTDSKTYLSVRMPMQWRMATGIADVENVTAFDGSLASRLGLFNDGMLGSWSDYGTYGDRTREKDGDFTYWNREEELEFQDKLCEMVPQGGEVIIDNSYNDLENAISDFKKMHITYLNSEYDENVLNKWANTVYEGDDDYAGMDGKSYIERHLGYRIFINESSLSYDLSEDNLNIRISLLNEGFAPLYYTKDCGFVLLMEDGSHTYIPLDVDLRKVKSNSEEEFIIEKEISLSGLSKGNIEVYFQITDPTTGDLIFLANEEEPTEIGYSVGNICLGEIDDYRDEFEKEYISDYLNDLKGELEFWKK